MDRGGFPPRGRRSPAVAGSRAVPGAAPTTRQRPAASQRRVVQGLCRVAGTNTTQARVFRARHATRNSFMLLQAAFTCFMPVVVHDQGLWLGIQSPSTTRFTCDLALWLWAATYVCST